MSEHLTIDQLIFEVRRSGRRKTIGLTVDRDGSLIAHLPEGVNFSQAEEAIKQRLPWVYQKLSERGGRSREGVFRRPEFVDGEGFYFLGRHYRLKLIYPDANSRPVQAMRFEGDRLLFNSEQVGSGEDRLAEYYTRAAHPYLNEAVERWKRIVGVEPKRYVEVIDLGFRWGSSSSDGTLNFHWRVMQLPPPVIDYVVVHELAHLKVRDHSEAFWREVRRALPNFEGHRDWLRQHGGDL